MLIWNAFNYGLSFFRKCEHKKVAYKIWVSCWNRTYDPKIRSHSCYQWANQEFLKWCWHWHLFKFDMHSEQKENNMFLFWKFKLWNNYIRYVWRQKETSRRGYTIEVNFRVGFLILWALFRKNWIMYLKIIDMVTTTVNAKKFVDLPISHNNRRNFYRGSH